MYLFYMTFFPLCFVINLYSLKKKKLVDECFYELWLNDAILKTQIKNNALITEFIYDIFRKTAIIQSIHVYTYILSGYTLSFLWNL